jgi:hypothetical protein
VIGCPATARCDAIGRPITPRPTKPSDGGRDVMAFRVYEKGGRRAVRSAAPSMQANTA